MKRAVFSGSFDPFTNGHLDILLRASKLFDEVCVAVLMNTSKTPVFTPRERVDMIIDVLACNELANVRVDSFSGLLVDYMRSVDAKYIVRGLRSAADYEYEAPIDVVNKRLYCEAETVFLISDPGLSYISSSFVREIGSLGGDIKGLVPDIICKKIAERLIKR